MTLPPCCLTVRTRLEMQKVVKYMQLLELALALQDAFLARVDSALRDLLWVDQA